MNSGLEIWDESRVAISGDFIYPSLIEVGDLTSLPLQIGRFFMIRRNKYKYTLVRHGLTKPSVAISLGDNTAFTCMKMDFRNGTLTMEIVCWSQPQPGAIYFLIFDSPTINPMGIALYTANSELVSDFSNKMMFPVEVMGFDKPDNKVTIGKPYSKGLLFQGVGAFKNISVYTNAKPWVWSMTMFYNLYYRSPSSENLRYFSEAVITRNENNLYNQETGLFLMGAPPILIDIEGFIPGK